MSIFLENLRTLHEHLWGKNVTKAYRFGKNYLTVDLTPFELPLNSSCENILFIRDEYQLTYKFILEHTRTKQRSDYLVTGQPGIGKTLFLIYVLIIRLEEQQPVALQMDAYTFALFNKHGVALHSAAVTSAIDIPSGTWALADADQGQTGPCGAFHSRKAVHVIYTSSPRSCHWKQWAKERSALRYIMDVWTQDELQALFTIHNFDVRRGISLFKKYGPNTRSIVNILMEPSREAIYLDDVQTGATKLARDFSTTLSNLEQFDFSSDISSKIFVLRPDLPSRIKHTQTIPTQYLITIFGLAISRQTASEKHRFFTVLSGHPYLRSAAGWLFENYAHTCFSVPDRIPLVGHIHNNVQHFIPTVREMISGPSKLNKIQPPFSFYWRPAESTFKGIDALIRSDNIVWALQYTISSSHCPATEGLDRVYQDMNYKTGIDWRLVHQQNVGILFWSGERGNVWFEYPGQI